MKLIIDIPTEFELDYKVNRFQDFFTRVLYSIEKVDGLYGLCGNYEKETTEMFLKAFDESVPMANIVEKLEELPYGRSYHDYAEKGIVHKYLERNDVLDIVKQEINNGLE